MANISAFMGLRPVIDLVEKVSELPYDVVNSEEAKNIAGDNQYSFYHIIKPEIDLPAETNIYDDIVYQTGRKNLKKFISEGILKQDESPYLYLYTQIMNGKEQTGLVSCVSVDDYLENRIKKHELTREDKERDRTKHLDTLSANTGPVFLLYKEDGSKRFLFVEAMKIEPVYDFTANDGVRHIVRIIKDKDLIDSFETAFKKDNLYVADGHHRAASAANVGVKRRENGASVTVKEESDKFLCVIFPHDQLGILAYNRVVKDLNGLKKNEYLEKIAQNFTIEKSTVKVPDNTHSFSMYIEKEWYTLIPLFEIDDDPIYGLDVKILQDKILVSILGIDDPRSDKRIDFIGGIRGTDELEKLVDSGKYCVAFSLYPTTVEQLIRVSDNDCIMPPKSTWFEPKLRSGLVVHLLD